MKRNWVRGASCIPLLLAASPALAQQGVWQTVGIGDCPGRDVASSRGFVPDPVRCDPASAGHTAVCWKDGCTYKNVPTAQCTGGANPGNMYTCVAAAASTGDWRPVGTGDCPGRDVGGGSRGPSPEAGRCNPAFAGYTAVCWKDGCTYKNVPTAQCTGGANPGNMYTCAPTATPVASTGDWRSVGTGDCPGRDVGSSRGGAPEAGRCNPAFAGYTAVCWKDGCTYKNVATAQCTGGANPGSMYTCQPSGQVSPTSTNGKGLDFQVTCTNCGHKQVDLGEHDFCALTGFVVGGFNSRCNVARSGSRWTLVATDPGPPDPWQGESQECSASCFDARR